MFFYLIFQVLHYESLLSVLKLVTSIPKLDKKLSLQVNPYINYRLFVFCNQNKYILFF